LPEPPPWRQVGDATGATAPEVGNTLKRMARPNLYQARQARIRSEERFRQPLPLWLRLIGYTIMGSLIAVVVSFFAYYILPAATVTVTPGREPITTLVQLTANPDLEEADLEENLLPGRLIETTIELSGTIRTSGTTQQATDKAVGQVVFINSGAQPVNVPSGTVVSTGTGTPISFRTTAPADVPGGIGQRATAPIEAFEAGTQGNVRANAINVVEGAMRFRVRVINTDGTFGGGSQLAAAVTQADRDQLLAQLQAEAEARAVETLQREVQAGEWLPPETVNTFVVAQVFSAFNDEEADSLSLSLRTLIQGIAVSEAESRNVLQVAVERALPERAKLVADSFTMTRLPGATAFDRSVVFTMSVSADYVVPVDPGEVRELISGLPPEDAASAIEGRWRMARAPEFYLDPTWSGTLPRLGRRIQVRVDYGGQIVP